MQMKSRMDGLGGWMAAQHSNERAKEKHGAKGEEQTRGRKREE